MARDGPGALANVMRRIRGGGGRWLAVPRAGRGSAWQWVDSTGTLQLSVCRRRLDSTVQSRRTTSSRLDPTNGDSTQCYFHRRFTVLLAGRIITDWLSRVYDNTFSTRLNFGWHLTVLRTTLVCTMFLSVPTQKDVYPSTPRSSRGPNTTVNSFKAHLDKIRRNQMEFFMDV